jgi:hypothetical protein
VSLSSLRSRSSCLCTVRSRRTAQGAAVFILVEGDGPAAEVLAAGTFQGAESGGGRGDDREAGGFAKVVAQRLAHEFGAAALLGSAWAFGLERHGRGTETVTSAVSRGLMGIGCNPVTAARVPRARRGRQMCGCKLNTSSSLLAAPHGSTTS